MAYLGTPDLSYKHWPTGEFISDPTLILQQIPPSATVTDRPLSSPGSPVGDNTHEYTSQLACLKSLQASRRSSAYEENEKNREILRQRGLVHSRAVNHDRMVGASNELRALTAATNFIVAQKVNVEIMEGKERLRLNARLAECQSGAEYRSGDKVHQVEKENAERLMRCKQKDLKDAYEKQIREKEQRLRDEYIALEEERRHIDKITREEARRRLEDTKCRLLEQQRWQQVICDFQDQRKADKAQAAEDLRKENEKIASHNAKQDARMDGQKALRQQRQEVAGKLRDRLVAEMRAKEAAQMERAQITEELPIAVTKEKELKRRKEIQSKKDIQREELLDAVKESRESHRLREEKINRDWEVYQDVLKKQAQAADYATEMEAKLHRDRQAAVVALLDQQREDHRIRALQEKQKENEWTAKEHQDTRLWQEFVDIEREKYLRKRAPELTSYVKGYHRFPHKKDDHLFKKILTNAAGGNVALEPLVNGDHQLLVKLMPQPGSTFEVYGNMQDARLHEIYGIGSS